MDGSRKARVAAASASAAGNHHALVRGGEIEYFLAGLFVVHYGPDRNLQKYVDAFPSALVGAFPVASAFRLVFRIETEMDQRVVALAGFHNYISTLAAVAAGRSAAGYVFLAAKRHAAIAAVARFDSDFSFVDKHNCTGLPVSRVLTAHQKQKPRPEGEAEAASHSSLRPLTRAASRADCGELVHDFHRFDHHKLAHRALVQELDAARDFGKQSVVFAAADIQSRFHASAALPHDDGAPRNDLPAECLESQPLRVRVAPVS